MKKFIIDISRITFLLLTISLPAILFSQENEKKIDEKSPYQFTIDYVVPQTPVKNQAITGTCWDFATISFLESEMLRMGKDTVDLSEMFIVRQTYPHKAENYVRLHGNATFSEGGQSHDVIDHICCYGIVPEQVYPGMNIDENKHNHGEMFAILQAVVNGASKSRKLTPNWQAAFAVVLNTYLGAPPIDFTFNGNKYTPKSFAEKYCGWNLTDYIELTSYLHHPFYEQCRLEIPDNWTCNDDYYNIPIDDLEKIIDYAIQNGYSIVWDGDVSERDFSTRETGYAIITEKDWDDKSEAERKAKITTPLKEKKVTQEMRQLTFDNYLTTDDHLMHIVGLAHDQKGTKFYYTKNSGGVIDRKNEGYVYMSQAYVRLKTVAIMVNKNCLPKKMLTKLFLK